MKQKYKTTIILSSALILLGVGLAANSPKVNVIQPKDTENTVKEESKHLGPNGDTTLGPNFDSTLGPNFDSTLGPNFDSTLGEDLL